MKKCSMFMKQKTQYCQDVRSSQLDVYIQRNPNQNPSKLFYGYQQIDCKYTWRSKRPRIANTILKKNKIGGLTLFNVKTYCKATAIKNCGFGGRTDKKINGTEYKAQK